MTPTKTAGAGKLNEFSLVDKYTLGYRNREDKTNLPPGVLIVGSQNVLTDVNGRVSLTKGYTLDGQSSVVLAPILSSFDWEMHINRVQHLRAGFLTSAGNDGKLQYRYVTTDNTVTWRDLKISLTSTVFNFCDYWNATNSQAYLLFVNGAAAVYEWSGGVTTIASITNNTITKEGSTTWAEEGFYVTGTHSVTINGVDYQATGGWATTTLTGVTPDPTAAVIPITAGTIVHQTPETTAASGITSLPTTFKINGIANLRNQIYYGSLVSNVVYVSAVNNYKTVAFTSPVRVVGEGALLTMDAPWRAFISQENYMTLFAGLDQIYQTQFILSSDLAKEDFQIQRLKTTALQGAQSQHLTSKIKNNVVFISNEPILNSLGRVDNVVLTPQITDLSFPVINDFDTYDFTDGAVAYWQNYILVAVPQNSIIRIYNMTLDPTGSGKNHYWEAPLTTAISCFSIIDGELYGHSYLTSESYKMFTGYNFNGHPIDARAIFSYQNYGSRFATKGFNQFYSEGYISPNTTLNLNFDYELNGFGGHTTFQILGTDTQIVQTQLSDASLGKLPLGKASLGGGTIDTSTQMPPKFRVINTFPKIPFYEMSPSYTSVGIDFNWSILAFGGAATATAEGNNAITQ